MRHFFVLFLLTQSLAFSADSREDGTWEFFTALKSKSEERITVRIFTGPWEPSDHKIEKKVANQWQVISGLEERDSENPVSYRIDGRESIWGADGFGWPDREVKLFVIHWGDRIINVPRKNWRNYYWLLLYTQDETKRRSDIGGCWTKATMDNETGELVIISNGGGGAGWYAVTWRIKPDGTVSDFAKSLAE